MGEFGNKVMHKTKIVNNEPEPIQNHNHQATLFNN